jgi:undecaprenyl-diphosphatase
MAGSPMEAIRPGDFMESLNQTFFLWLNAPEHPVLWRDAGHSLPNGSSGPFRFLIGIGWLRGSENTRKALLVATASGLLGC